MPTWHPFSPAELPEHSSPVLSQSKTDSSPVRGNISGPIPISSLMDDEALVENPSIGGSSSGARQALLVKSRDVGSETPATALNHPQPPLFPPDGSKRHVQIAQDARDDGRSSGAAKSSVNTPEPGHKRHRSIFSVDSTSGGGDNPQRKKSTLRGAIGRLFGRKKKTTSRADTPSPSNNPSSVIDSQYGRAIRSQPVEPKDEPATESARDSPQPRPNLSRRRPGSQSVHARPTKTDEPSGLTPRPSSVTGWVVEHGFPGWDDFDDIGRAITKDLSGLKRRSQSLSALATTSETLDGDPRRFSGEIRYWRDSYETQGKSSIATSHPGVEDQEDDHEKNEPIENPSAQAPVEPFKFPDVSDMSELSGMKITDVANLQHRIRSLESKTESLERTVENLSNFVLELDPFRNPSVSSSKSKGPATNKGGGEGPSSGNPRIHRGFQGQITGMSSSNSGDNGVLDTQPAMDAQTRPLSSVTIRGATSLPSLSNDTPRPLTMDQYTTLMALIDTERSSRVALEDKIKSLSHQINVMSKSAEKALGPKGYGFSKPSVGSAFDYDEEEDEDVTSTQSRRLEKRSSRSPWKGKERMVSRKSRTAITPDDKGHDDDSSPTPYATTHSDETDTDVLLPGKKKGRTLSLSKMTSKVS